MTSYRWSAAFGAARRGRFIHAVRLWRRTKLWSNDHFPGCPQHYDPDANCFDPDDLCKFAREYRWYHGVWYRVQLRLRP